MTPPMEKLTPPMEKLTPPMEKLRPPPMEKLTPPMEKLRFAAATSLPYGIVCAFGSGNSSWHS